MPNLTTVLNLTLPELNEFVDSWNEPLNQNFEDLDDWISDLAANLVGSSGSGSTWSTLRGSLGSLAERLDVSIQANGDIDVSGSSDILDMATSATKGAFSNPRDRLNDGDFEVFESRQPVADGRFSPMAVGGPSAGFPTEELDAGIALRSADFGRTASEPISSPQRPWAPGLATGGGSPLITAAGPAADRIFINGTTPAVFNIDGYIFRLREQVLFDFSLIPGLVPNDYVWIYVSREETSYNDPTFLYSEAGGTPVQKDLRKLKNGTDGVSSGSTLTAATGTLDTAPFTVKEGDVLVIEGAGAAAGDYVIDALDGTTPNTKLTIKGTFKADLSGLVYHVRDRFMPNIGAAIAASSPSLATSRPPSFAGRVYIGRVQAGTPITSAISFTKGGVYDSGWISVDGAAWATVLLNHNLGVLPANIDLWVREDATSPAYRPLVRRTMVTHFDEGNTTVDAGDAKKNVLLVPSMYVYSTEVDVTVELISDAPTSSPAEPSAIFTNAAGSDVISPAELRIIARR